MELPAGLALSPPQRSLSLVHQPRWTGSNWRAGTQRRGWKWEALSGPLIKAPVLQGPRGDARPLLAKGSCPQDSGSVSSIHFGLGHRCWPGGGFHITECLHQGPPCSHFVVGLAWPEWSAGALGPWRGTGWACLAGPAGNRGRGAASDLEQNPGPHGLHRPTGQPQN